MCVILTTYSVTIQSQTECHTDNIFQFSYWRRGLCHLQQDILDPLTAWRGQTNTVTENVVLQRLSLPKFTKPDLEDQRKYF
jgi:hypothetical protein